jgi:photosystem II stability/assembly factor-like uncharacterized protein
MDPSKTSERRKLSSMGALLLTFGLFAGAIITQTPAAAAPIDCGDSSAAITDCDDVSPRTDTFPIENNIQHSVSGRILSLTVSTDGQRLYAGSFSGVWRSNDAGRNWHQLTRPQPSSSTDVVPGALGVPNVFDVIVSPANKDVVLAATGSDTRIPAKSESGIYRSSNGGDKWDMVHQFSCPPDGRAAQIVFAPDDSSLVYAAGGCAIAISRDSGSTWIEKSFGQGSLWHIAVGPRETSRFGGLRRIYAAGDNQIWYSQDGGNSWVKDRSTMLPSGFGGFPDAANGSSPQILAIEPGHPDHVYLAVRGLANGPSYYQPSWAGPDGFTRCNTGLRQCGEGSLWLGDYSNFSLGQGGIWTQQPGPPAYVWNSTGSGNLYIVTKKTPAGYLLFFSDLAHVHVSAGRPTGNGWHRLDGRDASQGYCEKCFGNDENGSKRCNHLLLHVDPHAFAVSADFDMTLTAPFCTSGSPSTQPTPAPYNLNSVRASFRGTMWMANDGGIYSSTDGGANWELGSGLATLQPQLNFAGVAFSGERPALYMGVPDNDSFFTLNGGDKWKAGDNCGDCGPWFSDPAQPNRVLEFDRGLTWSLFVNPSLSAYPDPSNSAHARRNRPLPDSDAPASNWADENSPVSKGYKPVVLTRSNEPPLSDGDYIIIRNNQAGRAVLRTQKLSTISSATDWVRQGPGFLDEMKNANVVQASGGHSDTVFYVGDPDAGGNLWRWPSDQFNWKKIVPANDGSAKIARRFFVDPYNASRIYIIDEDAIKRSEDGGRTWQLDASLDNVVTENGSFSYEIVSLPYSVDQGVVIKDMVFDRIEPNTRFAFGNAGVFFTVDGTNWGRLLSTTGLPGHPVAAYFDRYSNPLDRSLYVAVNGRGMLQFHPIPAADTVKIESATLVNFTLNGHKAQNLHVSAASTAFPDAALRVSVGSCVRDASMAAAQKDYQLNTIVNCSGGTATVISSFGGSASARVTVVNP